MKAVVQSEGMTQDKVDVQSMGFENVEAGFKTNMEPMLFADHPRVWFKQQLIDQNCKLLLGEEHGMVKNICSAKDGRGVEVNGQAFDFAVNCTYNQSFPCKLKDYEFWYEVCIVPVVVLKEGKEFVSFGVFDGPFPSIEPYAFKGPLPSHFKGVQIEPSLSNLACATYCLEKICQCKRCMGCSKKRDPGGRT